ncbi:hypothetical protein CR513_34313, partial [Mucuna pruriens]
MEMSNLVAKLKSLKLKLDEDLIMHLVPTKAINKILYEIWIGKKPSIKHFYIWGCLAEPQPYRLHERKLNSRTVRCYFVGYTEHSRGYKFYDPTSRSFFEMGNVIILKEVEFEKEENIINVVFEEESVSDIGQIFVPITIQETTLVIGDNIQTIVLPQTPIEQPQQTQEVPLRRSIRERRHAILDDYIVFLQEHEDVIGLTEDDPIKFCQAMQSSNSKKWINAMKDGMKSMQENDIWNLIELPKGVKPIGFKWIFKTKKDSKGNIERCKTCLVAKGFTQKEDINYKEIFSLLSQENYISKVLFDMKDSKPRDTLIVKGDKFSLKQCPNMTLKKQDAKDFLCLNNGESNDVNIANIPHLDTSTCWPEELSLGNSYNPFNHGCRVYGLLRDIQPWDMAAKLCQKFTSGRSH